MAHLVLSGLTKRFGKTAAVDGVSLDVDAGSFVTLLGASGCGKTTLLRLIAGFAAPDEGAVIFEGASITHVPVAARGFGFVFQSYGLFPTKTVFENVAFGPRLRRWPKARIAARVGDLLEIAEIGHLAGRFPAELSGGQQQRVALARALALEPPLLLLDEPLSALDARIRESLRRELRRVVRQLGVTAIYVTHDQAEALEISDRIAVMDRGRLVQCDSPEGIYLRPASRFVAEFVGSTNILSCVDVGGRLAPAPEGATGNALVSLRPEHVGLAAAGHGPEARVLDVAFSGAAFRVALRLEPSGVELRALVSVDEWLALRAVPGDVLAVVLPLSRAVVLEGALRAAA